MTGNHTIHLASINLCETEKVSICAACYYQNQSVETRIESLWVLYLDASDLRRQWVTYP